MPISIAGQSPCGQTLVKSNGFQLLSGRSWPISLKNSVLASSLRAQIEGEVGIFQQLGASAYAFESVLAFNFAKRERVSPPLTSKGTSAPSV